MGTPFRRYEIAQTAKLAETSVQVRLLGAPESWAQTEFSLSFTRDLWERKTAGQLLDYAGGEILMPMVGMWAAIVLLAALRRVDLRLVLIAALWIGMVVRERIPTEVYLRIVRHVLLALALLLIGQYFFSA